MSPTLRSRRHRPLQTTLRRPPPPSAAVRTPPLSLRSASRLARRWRTRWDGCWRAMLRDPSPPWVPDSSMLCLFAVRVHCRRNPLRDWTLHEARNNFSALVDAALAGEPQRIAQGERSAVVVLAADEYERLRSRESADTPTFAELLLEIPQDDGEFERWPLSSTFDPQ